MTDRAQPASRLKAIDFRFIAYTNGLLLLVLAGALAIVGVTTFWSRGDYDPAFGGAAVTAGFFGGLLALANRGEWEGRLSIHTGYLLTVTCWTVLSLFSTLPLYYSELRLSFTDAAFETISGLTTTGATVLSGLDAMPADLLLWRSILQWLGGIGIVVVSMALLPMLRVGGMNLFHSESSDISGKVVARTDYFVRITVVVYAALTAVCAWLLYLAGMPWFDAVNHAMTTISTGGFSTHDASVAYFDSARIEGVIISFMLAGAMPLVMYAHFFLFRHGDKPLQRYAQVGGLLAVWAAAVAAVTLWNCLKNGMHFWKALRVTAFNVTSVATDTGFATADFSQWGYFPVGVMFFLLFVGGCAGSTSGSIKVFRWQILVRGLYVQLVKNLYPNTVMTVRYAGRPLDDPIMHGVRNFLFLYLLTFALLSLTLMGHGVDFLGSVSGVAAAMANAGPALTKELGPMGTFGGLPDGAKWTLSLAMILGRLELFTVFALLVPAFWRH